MSLLKFLYSYGESTLNSVSLMFMISPLHTLPLHYENVKRL